jgi:hypothetical protein
MPASSRLPALAAAAVLAGAPAAGAGEGPGHVGLLGPYSMDRDASGTSWQPESAGMPGIHGFPGSWRLMAHGDVFAVFTEQGGPRGGRQGLSTNMAMASASRVAAGGMLTLRAMGSLEPLMGPSGYRLILQTGEDGRMDGHTSWITSTPHDRGHGAGRDLLARRWDGGLAAFAYFGSPGEPALGPPAFMHRGSAAEIPVAPPEPPLARLHPHLLRRGHGRARVGDRRSWRAPPSTATSRTPRAGTWSGRASTHAPPASP